MAIDPVSAGLGGLSLLTGKRENQKAQGAADAAGQRARGLEDRLTKLFDVLFSNAENAVKSGVYDPEKRIAQLESDTARYEGRDMGNLAGTLATAGYRPGDSEIGTRLDAVKSKYRSFLDTMRDQIRTGSAMEIANLYRSADPGILGQAIAGARGEQQMNQGRLQNPAGFLEGFSGFLRNRAPSRPTPNVQGGSNDETLPSPVSRRIRLPVNYGFKIA